MDEVPWTHLHKTPERRASSPPFFMHKLGSGNAIFLKWRGDKTDQGIIWEHIRNMSGFSPSPSLVSFLSFPASAAVFLGSIHHLSEEIKWPYNVTGFSLLTPICSLLISFILSFTGISTSGARPLCPHLSWDISEAEHCLSPKDPGTYTVKKMFSNINIIQLYFLLKSFKDFF